MPKVHGYLRVSTADQADSGLGLAAGREAIRKEYEYRWKDQGFAFGTVFEDAAVSGAKPLRSRVGGLRLSNALEPGDVVIFPKLDRGFRNTEDLLSTVRVWQERQIRVVFLDISIDTATDVGRMVMGIMGLVAEFERARICQRSTEAVHQAMKRGALVGAPPWGCRVRGPKGKRYYEVIPEDLAAGKIIVAWKLAGHSYDAIRKHLASQGVWARWKKCDPPRWKATGSPWTEIKLRWAYKGTLQILRWLEKNQVRMPAEPKPKEESSVQA